MTTPPLVAPGEVEQVGRIHPDELANLDRLMEGDLTCLCGQPALWLSTVRPCGHQFPLCQKHADVSDKFWQGVLDGTRKDPLCVTCNRPAVRRDMRPI